ncbi:hypothetical protein QO034_22865 [Sedimentitalea sp. JM2-8]|uniref:Uncharacterized protein n=1 Tax=Sedimentitalea xiamensis TaxID=3050037 RepID=A0ABT7FMD8_9RHOB|nr:hypothetical protein [Sedimentitalea xiamensis]MDK3075899.1 hypothetical protein [Sedimentitalea xiamensis]
MHRPLALFALLAAAAPLHADVSPEAAAAALTDCRVELAADDMDALAKTVETIRGWGDIHDPTIRIAADFCLEVAAPKLAAAGIGQAPEVEAPATSAPVDARLQRYLDRATADGADMGAIAAEIASDKAFTPAAGAAREALEAAVLAYARPLPAAQAEANRVAYAALARIDPENATYGAKVQHYKDAKHTTGKRVLKSLIKTTEDFDGSSWSRHPSSPRYQDTRDYVTLYLLDDGKGKKSLELFLNYTSNDGWLFVSSASLNIDGDEISMPTARWFRDNDTEIWEYAGFQGPKMIDLARRIGDAKRVVVRFYGDEFYDDHVISSTEKKVIREMLAAWDYLQAG